MPAYEYRCRDCGDLFEVRRSMTETADRPPCPDGHTDTTRVFSAVAVGAGSATAPSPGSAPQPSSGGCCGGGCCG